MNRRYRTLKPPPGSKGRERTGLRYREDLPAEALRDKLDSVGDPLLSWLERIKDSAGAFTAGSQADDPLSPEAAAGRAAKHAQWALHALETMTINPQVRTAVLNAMRAVDAIREAEIAAGWEPLAARAVAQTPKPPTTKRRQWAQELAQELVQDNPGVGASALWKLIPAGEGDRYAGYEVFRDDSDNLRAYSRDHSDNLKKRTMLEEYISPLIRTAKK